MLGNTGSNDAKKLLATGLGLALSEQDASFALKLLNRSLQAFLLRCGRRFQPGELGLLATARARQENVRHQEKDDSNLLKSHVQHPRLNFFSLSRVKSTRVTALAAPRNG
jgi:hypothetical protein